MLIIKVSKNKINNYKPVISLLFAFIPFPELHKTLIYLLQVFFITKKLSLMQTQKEKIFLKGKRVYLYLPGKDYKATREIGYVENRIFHTSRKPSHIFRKLNALAVSYQLLKEGESYFDTVEIQFGFDILKVSREDYLKNGVVLKFKKNNLEMQSFISLDRFNKN